MTQHTHKQRFDKLLDTTVINKARQYSEWTLPYLMADVESAVRGSTMTLERDFQEIGALLLNNLAAKLARILFPMQGPFFRTQISGALKDYAKRRGISDTELKSRLVQLEREVNPLLMANAGVAELILALRWLIATGNVMLYRGGGRLVAYGLRSFVVRRDGDGTVLESVLREYTTFGALPPEIQAAVRAGNQAAYNDPEQVIEKYTRIHRGVRDGTEGYFVSQEVAGVRLGEAEGWYPAKLCPWFWPTWTLVKGEHYGRGLVEDFAGGFAKLSGLCEASTLYAVEIMRIVHLVGAASGADIDELTNAETGEYVRGDPSQIGVHEAGDARRLQEVIPVITETTTRLARAFMYQGGTRDAERVTMYELQRDAQEAEYALGGAYSTLSGSMQLPLAYLLMAELSVEMQIGITTGEAFPDVIAGIPALGRGAEIQNIANSFQLIATLLPIAQLDKRLSTTKLVDMIFAGNGVDPETIMLSKDEMRAASEADALLQDAKLAATQADAMAAQSAALTQQTGG